MGGDDKEMTTVFWWPQKQLPVGFKPYRNQ